MACIEDIVFDFGAAKRIWKPLVKWLVTGNWQPLMMHPGSVDFPRHLKRLGLYLHVPFCRNLCPYCPYNRVEYKTELFEKFERAAHQEIDIYADRMRTACSENGIPQPHIVSLYVGGGTPTVDPHGLQRLVTHIHSAFGKADDICIELHPAAMDNECLDILKSVGVTMLSVGVESVSDKLLKLIGRSHDSATALDAVLRAISKGFDSVNVDMMFALPTQTIEELDSDLKAVLSLNVDQISTYPIFGFPYTDLGRELGIKRIRRPNGVLIRRMLALIRQRAYEHGMKQCAVWSFLKPGGKKFSSITRHHYIGFGPSAASMTGSSFHVNTFNVDEYAAALPGKLPVALVMPMTKRLEMAYWLYWRAYEMKASSEDFRELFGESIETVFGGLFALPRLLGMVKKENGTYHVTEKAAYWIHRLQNEYSLNYINHLWGRCRTEAWPQEVRL